MTHRPYPQSVESERALLGGLLLDPDAILSVAERVRPEDFYRPDHGELFSLLVDLNARNEAIDTVSIAERISRGGKADRYGGVAYVVELPDHAPSTANLQHYAVVIREKSLLRNLIEASKALEFKAFGEPQDVGALLEEAMRNISSLGQQHLRGAWHAISLVVDDEIQSIHELSQKGGEVVGIPTGYIDLDRRLAGLQRSDLVILAARPAMGKTALGLNMAQHAAIREGYGVGFFSLEMSRGQLARRMMCAEAMVEASKVRRGQLDPHEWDRFLEASEVLRATHIYIDDTPGLSVGELRSRSRRLQAEQPNLGLIVIDYLQLMRGEDPRQSRQQQVSDISRGLKALAKDLNVPVLALSQLNRSVETRQDKRPLLSDLRESGAIEQDADVIMFIYRDEYYNPDSPDRGLAEVIIAKQRGGATGTVKLVFQGQYTRFDNHAAEDLLQ